ncbi:hypothetical protein LCGC14_1383240 [marine sediment metagenome]|uniref:Uncharacterized protein n=1 Tax=marine sediment metagenome TaxID=412755 RepID=A0A0F9N3P8_9ZZZZ
MRRRKKRMQPMTSEEYWEWRSWRARRIRWEELVLYLAVAMGFALIALVMILFS